MTLRTRLTDRLAHAPRSPSLLVVSDCYVGALLVDDLDGTADISLVTDLSRVAGRAPERVQTTVGDLTSVETLAGGADADVAVVVLKQDRRALLVSQLLRTKLDIDSLVVVLNDPRRHDLLDGIATDVVCRSTCLSAALSDALARTLPEHVSS